MADDVTLNSMSGGPVVATDDSGTGHVQIIKLAYSADGSRTPITADTNGLKVNVGNTVTVTLGSALPAGSAVIGAVTQSGTWNVGSTSAEAITTSAALAGTEKLLPLGAYNDYFSSWQPLQTTGGFSTKALWVALYGEASLAAGTNVIGGVTQADGPWTTVERGATIASTSASVTTTSGQIVASSATRRSIVLTNLGSDYVWIGASGVTNNQGIRLAPGQALTIDKSPTAAVHAKAASGTQTVAIFTESD